MTVSPMASASPSIDPVRDGVPSKASFLELVEFAALAGGVARDPACVVLPDFARWRGGKENLYM